MFEFLNKFVRRPFLTSLGLLSLLSQTYTLARMMLKQRILMQNVQAYS